ncbi:hypothetical protein ACFQE1_03230 [Halobium palmae]|uniref:CopG family transcriptional regulator n=1 Tax=Halobium palmae TaxID=1776492 RepID=A0ABD5RVE9_9EURY
MIARKYIPLRLTVEQVEALNFYQDEFGFDSQTDLIVEALESYYRRQSPSTHAVETDSPTDECAREDVDTGSRTDPASDDGDDDIDTPPYWSTKSTDVTSGDIEEKLGWYFVREPTHLHVSIGEEFFLTGFSSAIQHLIDSNDATEETIDRLRMEYEKQRLQFHHKR